MFEFYSQAPPRKPGAVFGVLQQRTGDEENRCVRLRLRLHSRAVFKASSPSHIQPGQEFSDK